MLTTRYISEYTDAIPVFRSDFLVIGSGIAGLFTALKASAIGSVTVLTKKTMKDSNTGLAQGGIAAAVHEEDSPFLHLEDTLEAGAGLCDVEAVNVLCTEGPDRVRELMAVGARFDTVNGKVALTREGAHGKARILHAADATGEAIRQALVESCLKEPAITIKEDQFLIDLLTLDKECHGALVLDAATGTKALYLAKATVMSTGGVGQLFRYTTNPEIATADGMGACFRAGCELADMEFIQFHPTVLAMPGSQRFLISEAVRGEGALLFNGREERFMSRYHPLKELAPRDIVARAIWNEMNLSGDEHVYLDVSHMPHAAERFPNIFRTCAEQGHDPTRERIPVSPAAHYMMGGIKTNLDGETNIYGLYACGETACTGVHGANRLASNSLLEGIVFGQRIVQAAASMNYRRTVRDEEIFDALKNGERPALTANGLDPAVVREQVRSLMWEQMGIIRSEAGLKTALRQLDDLARQLDICDSELSYYEVINILTVARVMTQAALLRQESRGAHFREDYPYRDDIKWARHLSFSNW